jgi:hypothetical protein
MIFILILLIFFLDSREFAAIIQARVPEFCMSGMSKLNEIDEELKRLNYSPEEEKKPLNYRIQV